MATLFSVFKNTLNTFQGQEPGERVLLFLRRHPITIILRIVGLLIAYVIPILLSFIFVEFIVNNELMVVYLFILSIWTLFVWVIIFYSLTMYTLDVWIVTDTRIIDSTQHGFFNRTVAELHLSRIQDIYVKMGGPLENIVNFGNLMIQTAGTEERFVFEQIPRPIQVKDTIMEISFPDNHQPKTSV